MNRILTLALLSLSLTPLARTQQPTDWTGEWGAFTGLSDGQCLDISGCHDLSCSFSISVKQGPDRCETLDMEQALTIRGSDATATLPGPDAAHSCKLSFHRDTGGSAPAITVTGTGDACSTYYCVGRSLNFNHTFALRSPQPWTGDHVEECFYMASPARMATCTDAALARLEDDWRDLYTQFPLDGATSDAGYQHTLTLDNDILKQCDATPDAAACLRARYTTDIAAMTAKQNAEIAASTERGDPAIGGHLAQKIAGRYRHRFANGDVQGDKYISTDSMTLTPVGKASIHFDIGLNFYNGHTCSISGGALYRKDGTFVFDDDAQNPVPNEPACRLAIVPTAKGVDLKDLGGCKMSYCGARGGFSGAGFLFTQRAK